MEALEIVEVAILERVPESSDVDNCFFFGS